MTASRNTDDVVIHEAVDRLLAAGTEAGLDADRIRTEAGAVAAAVAESAPGAPADWLRVFGRERTTEFFSAANAGRRLRTSPSDTLVALRLTRRDEATAYADALVELAAAAAVGLGRPGPIVAQVASEVATAQRGSSAAPAAPALPTPTFPTSTTPPAVDLTSFGSSAPTAGPAASSGVNLPTPTSAGGSTGCPASRRSSRRCGAGRPLPRPGRR
ncbi:hypothetical protein C8046_14870 [Serinibacter arcticus]|uniref:Uncharacterized protein n=1 Tax=Serinibacter arcticus TaxID=1655435 RepID=A0A2U1ZXN3_9MICO|nr:hypothetical protein [Serinibacter arcticus]PWD51739.1 hypothetical protein C8046_14870 [Serinibacter arcticus]